MGLTTPSKQWLITGASQGLGLAMALSALQAGHKVFAGARNSSKAAAEHPEIEAAGGKWLQLDVSSSDAQGVVSNAVKEAGFIDVVVNNAGIFIPGNIEDVLEEEMQSAMSTNFFGPIRVLKGVLPAMRARRSGTIIYNSSIFGFYPCPAGAMYSSPKAAGDMLMDTLRIELAPFNIHVVTLNAALFKTNVLSNAQMPSSGFSQHYLAETAVGGSIGLVGRFSQDPDTHMPGDPIKFADRAVEVVDGTGHGQALSKTHHIFMGKDALLLAQKKLGWLNVDLEASQKIGVSTDIEGATAPGVAPIMDL